MFSNLQQEVNAFEFCYSIFVRRSAIDAEVMNEMSRSGSRSLARFGRSEEVGDGVAEATHAPRRLLQRLLALALRSALCVIVHCALADRS